MAPRWPYCGLMNLVTTLLPATPGWPNESCYFFFDKFLLDTSYIIISHHFAASCSDVTCQRGQTCVTDQNGAPHCVRCFTNCPEPETPDWRCGSNGVSYPSLCHIRSAICLSNAAVTIAYTGRCRGKLIHYYNLQRILYLNLNLNVVTT